MSTDTIITFLLTGITTVALSLAMWILNSASKRVSELEKKVGELSTKLHEKIDLLKDDRANKWLNKERDCREEESRISRIEARLGVYDREK